MAVRAHYKSPLARATKAHTALVLFAKIQDIAESPELNDYHATTSAIISHCQTAKAACLRSYDRAVANAGEQAVTEPAP